MGIAVGRSNTYANYNSINTRELVVYGTTYPLGDADRDGNTNISDVLSTITHCVNNLAYNTYRDTNGDSKITLLDAIRILKECVK